MRIPIIITVLYFLPIISIGQVDADSKVKIIDKYALQIDSILNTFKKEHDKCCDCFGTDTYFKDSSEIVKIHNYQSCFNIDFYYENNELILVTIDGSFNRECGWTEAHYCWNETVKRDYTSRIYYEHQTIIKDCEFGSKPCCQIKPCGDYQDTISFNEKAKDFLKTFPILKVNKKLKFKEKTYYILWDFNWNIISSDFTRKIDFTNLKYNTIYYLDYDRKRHLIIRK